MTDYRPGQVAVATVRGVPNVRVMAGRGTSEPRLRWLTTDLRLLDVENDGWYFEYDATDVRPLVVLDPENLDDARRLISSFDAAYGDLDRDDWDDAIPAALTALRWLTKPPRIPEPGLWGVVEARTNFPTRRWVHHEEGRWVSDMGTVLQWEDLIDPVLIREGVFP